MGINYKKSVSILLVILIVMGGLNGLFNREDRAYAAADFAGGTGTIEDPYQIATPSQLNKMRYYLRASFKLTAEIDLNGYTETDGNGWLPIGGEIPVGIFRGNLDGNGFKIKNLRINRPTISYVGLFGRTGGKSNIRNITLESVNVIGGSNTGALIGNLANPQGTINNSSVTGSVHGVDGTGGLVGVNQGAISTSFSTASISGSSQTGGLVGYNEYTISNSYARGSVTGSAQVGGLVGYSQNTIKNSYATGRVIGTSDAGGLLGYNNNGTITNSFYDTATTGQTDTNKGTGKTTSQMQNSATYTGVNWDLTSTGKWGRSSAENNKYPYLIFANIAAVTFAGGTGTSSYPYQVASAKQLNELRFYLDSGIYFKLIADIDLSSYPAPSGWVPIGNFTKGIVFGGNLDGNGFKIRNLTIIALMDGVGLFSTIAYGELKNITLENVNVYGMTQTGALVGHNNGTISNSSVTGSVYGYGDSTGGLVGVNLITIRTSYSKAYVSGTNKVGGLAGFNQEVISDSYASGKVIGSSSVGGLVGVNEKSITNSYAAGLVSGTSNLGGLVGSSGVGGTTSNSFYDWETTGKANAGIGRSTEAMKDPTTYSDPSWDLVGIWGIDSALNNGYPFLNALPSSAIAGVTVPSTGATPVTSLASTDAYTASIAWSPVVNGTFAGAKEYTATITLLPKAGYTLAGVTSNYFTVVGANATTNAGNSGVITAVFPATDAIIATAAIAGVTAPVWGETPVAAIASTSEYTASIIWSPTAATFAAATVYTATITLTPNAGYTLTGVGANYFTVAGAAAINSVNSGVITAVFPATKTTIVTGAIEGITAPVKGATPLASVIQTQSYGATLAWSPADAKFKANTVYTATITLTPNAGYTLTGLGANAFTIVGATATNLINSGEITAVFPATAAASTAATLTSTIGIVSTGETESETIKSIPYSTTLSAFRAAVTQAVYATFEIYDADEMTLATTLATGKKVIVTAEDGTTKVIYTVTVAANPAKAITAFTFAGLNPVVTGTVNETNKTIVLTVPYGTNVTALIPTFTTTGASVKVGGDVQVSGTTEQNFTNTVTYTAVAADNTTEDYDVMVNVAANPAKAITAFTFAGLNPMVTGTVNETNKTIALTVPYGTNVTALIPTFTTTGASVKVGGDVQVSGTMEQNFTNTVTYTVVAANNTTADYDVTVSVAANPAKAITAFTFAGLNPMVTGTVNETNKTIALTVPYGTNVTALVPTFTTTGASVKVGSNVHMSGITAQDFTSTVTYTVVAADNTTADYDVTVNVAANNSTGGGGNDPKTPTPTPVATSAPTPAPTATPVPVATPTPTATPKPFYNEKVNIDVIKSLVEKAKSEPAVVFKDVPNDSPAAKTIELATKLGIIKGYEDGSFRANATVTRAEFSTMLVKALGLTSKGDSSFKDTKGHWAAAAIATLRENGIINGYLDGTFKPNQTISRAEIVAMLSKVINTTLIKEAKFKDVSGNWAEAEIDTLSNLGIIRGTEDGSFKPNAYATRSESLLMILRMLNVSLGLSLDIE